MNKKIIYIIIGAIAILAIAKLAIGSSASYQKSQCLNKGGLRTNNECNTKNTGDSGSNSIQSGIIANSTIPESISKCQNEKLSSIFSNIENKCIGLSEFLVLNIYKKTENVNQALLLFSSDKSKAEIFLPTNTGVSVTLDRNSTNGSYIYGDLELTQNNGYILKKGSEIIYSLENIKN